MAVLPSKSEDLEFVAGGHRSGLLEQRARLAPYGLAVRNALAFVLPPVSLIVIFLAAWEISCRWWAIPEMIVPPPSSVWTSLKRAFPLILQHAVPTTLEMLAAFATALVSGIVIAGFIVRFKLLERALFPNLVMFQFIPKIALAPLFIVWFGIDSESRLTYAIFISFFPILIATVTGLRNIPPDLLRLARSIPASEWQTFITIRFPIALPYIFSGMKVAVTMSMIGIIVGEFITSQRGLGYLILFAASKAETALIMATISILCVIGLSIFSLVLLAERIFKRWYGEFS